MTDIGWAVAQLREGRRVRRAGWNGKGLWLGLVPSDRYLVRNSFTPPVNEVVNLLPWVGMYTATGEFVPWLCSQTDLLATDWELVNV